MKTDHAVSVLLGLVTLAASSVPLALLGRWVAPPVAGSLVRVYLTYTLAGAACAVTAMGVALLLGAIAWRLGQWIRGQL